MVAIPLLVKKFFGRVLEDARNKAIEELYKVLNLVVLKNENSVDNPENEEAKFYRKLSLSTNDYDWDVSTMVKDSILFEDTVVTSYAQMDKPSQGMEFRESFLSSSSSTDREAILKEAVFI